jgi:hypothetical protein
MRHTRHTHRALAASFVVTFAGGCDSKATQPAAAPTVDVGPAVPASAPTSAPAAAADSAAIAPSPSVSSTATTLPPAPSVGHVAYNGDGTCTWRPDISNLRRLGGGRIMVNPPPPRRVQCPPSDGGP